MHAPTTELTRSWLENDPDSQQGDSLRVDELRNYSRAHNLLVIAPRKDSIHNVLLLDIDGRNKWECPLAKPESFTGRLYHKLITPSKSGGIHVYLLVEEEQAEGVDTYLLQAALGSDPVRELLNTKRWRKGIYDYPNVLFELPEFWELADANSPIWREALTEVDFDE